MYKTYLSFDLAIRESWQVFRRQMHSDHEVLIFFLMKCVVVWIDCLFAHFDWSHVYHVILW